MPILKLKLLREIEGERKLVRNNLLIEVESKVYKREFMAYLSSARLTEEQILTDPLVPASGDQHPANANATVVNVSYRPTENPKMKIISVIYDTDRLVGLITDDPLNQPPEIHFATYKYNAPMVLDAYGTPTMSSAGNRLDPVPTVEYERVLITVTRNVPIFLLAKKRHYQFKLNKFPFFGFPARAGRINDYTGHRTMSSGFIFWQEVIEMEFRTKPDSFSDFYLDNDFRRLDGTMYLDPISKMPYTTPTLLNGRGRQISDAKFVNTVAIGPDSATVTCPGGLIALFPPKPNDPLPDGVVPGPANTEFFIKVTKISDPSKYETMRVYDGLGTGTWKVDRKNMSRTEDNWPVNSATVQLLPYYLQFHPYKPVDWRPLKLEEVGLL